MSWKTSLFGILAAIGGAVALGIRNGTIDASHLPAWLKGVADLISVAGIAGVGLFARDNNKTSEQVGANKSDGGSTSVGIVLLLLCTLGGGMLLGGCASERKITYEAVNASYIGVDAALSAWGEYVAKFHPSAAEEQRVSDAYDKYQKACDLAIDGAGTLDAQAALNDLIAVIQSFGIVIQARPPPGASH